MRTTRRELLTALGALPLAAAPPAVETPADIEPLWKSPDGHPNALEATAEGLWVGEQITDMAYLLDWESGKVIRAIQTQSSNTAGIAYGGGFLWVSANGPTSRRPARPGDGKVGEVHKIHPSSGRTVARYTVPGAHKPWLHGLCWGDEALWVVLLQMQRIGRYEPESFVETHSVPFDFERAHGIAYDGGTLWCLFSDDYLIHQLDVATGRTLRVIALRRGIDPDPHGMTRHGGVLYYSDSGLLNGGGAHGGKYSGYICRLHV